MKRVAHISLHGDPLEPLGSIEAGGQNVYVKNVAVQLAKRGIKVDVFTRWNDPSKPRVEEIVPGARSIRLKGGPVGFVRKEDTLDLLPELLDEFAGFLNGNSAYDVVHSHYYVEGAFGLRVAHEYGLPQVHTFHSLGRVKYGHEKLQGNPDPFAYLERFDTEKELMAHADLLVATSPFEAEDFRDCYDHHNSNVTVIPCGLDPGIFYPRDRQASRQKLGLPRDRDILLYVGRLDARKGIEILLFAYRKLLFDLKERGDNVLLAIVGGNLEETVSDPELAHFRRLAASLQLEECGCSNGFRGAVAFVGSQPQSVVADYYSAADISIAPSYYEPFGMVAIEAQACGTPVVASAVGGLRYAVEDGTGGLLAKPYSPEDLCEKVMLLLRNPELRKDVAATGQRRVAKEFTWDAVTGRLLRAYGVARARKKRLNSFRWRIREARAKASADQVCRPV